MNELANRNGAAEPLTGNGMTGNGGMMTGGAAAGSRALSLADYEARIHLYKEQIGTGYIGIGRTLNEAKAAGVVPHGQWEAWVTETTGLTPRQAQRCMQAATEIREGSALAQLEMSKALMLLGSGLEADAQEEIAGRAAEDGATVRQLREEIQRAKEAREAADAENAETVKALKVQLVKETGTAAEIREALKKARSEREALEQQMRARDTAWRGRLEEETGNAYRRGSDEGRLAAEKEAGAEIRKEFQGKLDFANMKAKDREERLRSAEEALRKAQREASQKWDEGYRAGMDQAAEIRREVDGARTKEIDQLQRALDASEKELRQQEDEQGRALEAKTREIEELKAELEAAEAREAKRAAELAEMKKARTQAGMDAARGIGAQEMGTVDLAAAVRDFIGRAGVLPQMGNIISGMGKKERETILANVETVGKWVSDSLAALGVVKTDARIQ